MKRYSGERRKAVLRMMTAGTCAHRLCADEFAALSSAFHFCGATRIFLPANRPVRHAQRTKARALLASIFRACLDQRRHCQSIGQRAGLQSGDDAG